MSSTPDVLDRAATALDWWREIGGGATSSILGTGAVERLERAVAARLGHRHGVALPSGTIALRAALEAVGVGPGDEVIVPAVDWGAATAAVRSLDATPVAAGVAPPTLAICPDDVAARLTERTRAVVVTHLFGITADVAAVRAVLPPPIVVVEDCAQGFGAHLDGVPAGAVGDAAVCSFGPGKVIDAGEGGLVATSDPDLYRRVVAATQHPAGQVVRGVSPPQLVNLTSRIHPVAAVMACHQIEHLDTELEARAIARRTVIDRTRSLGAAIDVAAGASGGSGWSVPALLADEDCAQALSNIGVEARPVAELLEAMATPDNAPVADIPAKNAHLLRLAVDSLAQR